jgi:hypothetical protein
MVDGDEEKEVEEDEVAATRGVRRSEKEQKKGGVRIEERNETKRKKTRNQTKQTKERKKEGSKQGGGEFRNKLSRVWDSYSFGTVRREEWVEETNGIQGKEKEEEGEGGEKEGWVWVTGKGKGKEREWVGVCTREQ